MSYPSQPLTVSSSNITIWRLYFGRNKIPSLPPKRGGTINRDKKQVTFLAPAARSEVPYNQSYPSSTNFRFPSLLAMISDGLGCLSRGLDHPYNPEESEPWVTLLCVAFGCYSCLLTVLLGPETSEDTPVNSMGSINTPSSLCYKTVLTANPVRH